MPFKWRCGHTISYFIFHLKLLSIIIKNIPNYILKNLTSIFPNYVFELFHGSLKLIIIVTLSYTHAQTHKHTHTHTLTNTPTHPHPRKHPHTHTHTHTHKQTLVSSIAGRIFEEEEKKVWGTSRISLIFSGLSIMTKVKGCCRHPGRQGNHHICGKLFTSYRHTRAHTHIRR